MTEQNRGVLDPGEDPAAAGEAAKEALAQAQAAQNAQPEGTPDAGDTPVPDQTGADPATDGVADTPAVDADSFDLTGDTTPEGEALSDLVEEQILKNGKFSDHFKGKLKEKGLDPGTIQDLEAGALHRRTQGIQDFIQHAGGGETFGKIQKWAQENLPMEERQFYMDAAQSKDAMARQVAARDLAAKYAAANRGPAQLDGRRPQAQPDNFEYKGPQQMVDMMGDVRQSAVGTTQADYLEERGKTALATADHLGIVPQIRGRS